MAAPKGHKKWGGRSKGVLNKGSQQIRDKVAELNCDPVTVLAHFTNNDWKALGYEAPVFEVHGAAFTNYEMYIKPETRAQAARELLKYLHPQLKAIDLKSNGEAIGNSLVDILKALNDAKNG